MERPRYEIAVSLQYKRPWDKAHTSYDLCQRLWVRFCPYERRENLLLPLAHRGLWRQLTPFQQALWMLDELDAQWRQLVARYPAMGYVEVKWSKSLTLGTVSIGDDLIDVPHPPQPLGDVNTSASTQQRAVEYTTGDVMSLYDAAVDIAALLRLTKPQDGNPTNSRGPPEVVISSKNNIIADTHWAENVSAVRSGAQPPLRPPHPRRPRRRNYLNVTRDQFQHLYWTTMNPHAGEATSNLSSASLTLFRLEDADYRAIMADPWSSPHCYRHLVLVNALCVSLFVALSLCSRRVLAGGKQRKTR